MNNKAAERGRLHLQRCVTTEILAGGGIDVKTLFAFALVIFFAAESPVYAQSIDCSAFRRNADETWSATRNERLRGSDGTVEVEAGLSFHRGVPFNGVDLTAILDEQCR
jgi:hypothetical protein